jgi:hypothetical protein
MPAAVLAFSSARRAAKSNIGEMCHLHETDDHALGDSTPSSRGVVDVYGVYHVAETAMIKRLVTPFRKVVPI